MIKCENCEYKINATQSARHRAISQCRAGLPTTDSQGFAQWPCIRKDELGCAEGVKKKDK